MEALHVGGGRPRASHLQSSICSSRAASLPLKVAPGASSGSDGGPNMCAIGSNLTALCEHVQVEGWKSKAFSDVILKAMGQTFHLHRFLLSRSSYFRKMLQGPWKEAGAPEITLHIDDDNVNADALETALAYLYGHYPKLDDSNAFRVLAAGSFLDLQDLCSLCTDFIISELWTDNFLAYQAFAENQDYGLHGERVRKACWGYLCRGGAVELREILPKLSAQTLQKLLASDELWVLSEEKRFELAFYVLIARGGVLEMPQLSSADSKGFPMTGIPGPENSFLSGSLIHEDQNPERLDNNVTPRLESDQVMSHVAVEGAPLSALNEATKSDVSFECDDSAVTNSSAGLSSPTTSLSLDSRNSVRAVQCSGVSTPTHDHDFETPSGKPLKEVDSPQLFNEMPKNKEASTCGDIRVVPDQLSYSGVESSSCGRLGCEEAWHPLSTGDHVGHSPCLLTSETTSSSNSKVVQDRCSSTCPTPSWGGRVVDRRVRKAFRNGRHWSIAEDWEAFLGVFAGGGVLYCHMAFDHLLHMRGRLEKLGFPCKSVIDSLWLQTLLRQQVLTIAADTCRNCCLVYENCNCRQFNASYEHERLPGLHYRDDSQSSGSTSTSIFPGAEGIGGNSESVGRIPFRNTMDGLAGIGRGTTFRTPGSWPAPKFLYVPSLGAYGARGNPQQGEDGKSQMDPRLEIFGRDLPAAHCTLDGPAGGTGLTQGGTAPSGVGASGQADLNPRNHEDSSAKPPNTDSTSFKLNITKNLTEDIDTRESEEGEGGSILLDLNTPLRNFPSFRFGVEFEDVHRLLDGQAKHSPETFYAGSLWKVSVQAFNDEDPRGRRTLGLFLHRRKAEDVGPHRKVFFYTDTREKVTARYQVSILNHEFDFSCAPGNFGLEEGGCDSSFTFTLAFLFPLGLLELLVSCREGVLQYSSE
uniref:BTB domain-containing protein n=1 Tax=Physcomitrium patens TaxID=3218 RepID=A0A7I4F794_PHYPA